MTFGRFAVAADYFANPALERTPSSNVRFLDLRSTFAMRPQNLSSRLRAAHPQRQSWRKRLWLFVNSSFGLWLISAVFVSGLTTATTNYIERLRLNTRQEQAQALVREELVLRYARMASAAPNSPDNELLIASILRGNEAELRRIFIQPRACETAPSSIRSPACMDLAELMFQVETGPYGEVVKKAAQDIRLLAVRLEVRMSIRSEVLPEQRTKYLVADIRSIRIRSADLLDYLGFKGPVTPGLGKDYMPNF